MTSRQARILLVTRTFLCYLPHNKKYIGVDNVAKFYTLALSFCGDNIIITAKQLSEKFLSEIDEKACNEYSKDKLYEKIKDYHHKANKILLEISPNGLTPELPYEIVVKGLKKALKDIQI